MNELTIDEAVKIILLQKQQDVALVMRELISWVPEPTKVRYANCMLKMKYDWDIVRKR